MWPNSWAMVPKVGLLGVDFGGSPLASVTYIPATPEGLARWRLSKMFMVMEWAAASGLTPEWTFQEELGVPESVTVVPAGLAGQSLAAPRIC